MFKKFTLFLFLSGIGGSLYAEDKNLIETSADYTARKIEKIFKLRGKAHRWTHIVRGFRKDHHFAFLGSTAKSNYQVVSFGTQKPQKIEARAAASKFRYSFHIPYTKRFGYFLGTGFEYQKEQVSVSQFNEPTILKYPGFTVGLVFNFSPVLRLSGGLELYLERWEDFGFREKGDDEVASFTVRTSSYYLGMDIFYNLYWAIRIEAGSRQFQYRKPRNSEGKLVDMNIRKSEDYVAAGLIYHLL